MTARWCACCSSPSRSSGWSSSVRSCATSGDFVAAASAGTGGSAWLAGGLVALLSFFMPSSAGAATHVAASPANSVANIHARDVVTSARRPGEADARAPWPSSVGRDAPRPHGEAPQRSDPSTPVQRRATTTSRSRSNCCARSIRALLGQLRQMIGERRDGVLDVPNTIDATLAPRDVASSRTSRAPWRRRRPGRWSVSRARAAPWRSSRRGAATTSWRRRWPCTTASWSSPRPSTNCCAHSRHARVRNTLVVYLGTAANSTTSCSPVRSP